MSYDQSRDFFFTGIGPIFLLNIRLNLLKCSFSCQASRKRMIMNPADLFNSTMSLEHCTGLEENLHFYIIHKFMINTTKDLRQMYSHLMSK